MSSDIRFFQYVQPKLWYLRLIFHITMYQQLFCTEMLQLLDVRADSQKG